MIVIDQRDKNVYRIARFVHFLIEMYTILMIHLRLGPRQRHEASLVPDMAVVEGYKYEVGQTLVTQT
jgi:hypothetical protein